MAFTTLEIPSPSTANNTLSPTQKGIRHAATVITAHPNKL
jgi:hypothetical protein